MIRFFIFLLFVASQCIAQLPEEINLEADSIRYLNNKQTIIAEDNVILTYEDFTITTNYFKYDLVTSTVSFPKHLTLFNKTEQLKASSLNYNFDTFNGIAHDIAVEAQGLLFRAEKAKSSKTRIFFSHTYATKCNLDKPDYFLTSDHLVLRPLIGYVVARKNLFSSKFLPISIPIPFFVYGSYSKGFLSKNPYLPEIGKNNTEGYFATYKVTYIPRDNIVGTFDFGYTEKLNYTLGGSNLYSSSRSLTHGLSYKFYPAKSLASIYYKTSFKEPLSKPKETSDNFFDAILNRLYRPKEVVFTEANFIIQHNALIRDYWVSFYPKLELLYHNLITPQIKSNSYVSFSNTTEDDLNNYRYTNSTMRIKNIVHIDKRLHKNITLSSEFFSEFNVYSRSQMWSRLFLNNKLSFSTPLNPTIHYYQALYQKNKSPFLYEKDITFNSTEIGLSINDEIGNVTLTAETFYKIEEDAFREIDLSFFYKSHCWGAGLLWRAQQNAVQFLFNFF